MSEKMANAVGALMCVALVIGFGLGVFVSSLPETTKGDHTTVINCGNLSANDGGDTPERDITVKEFKKFCE